MRVFRQKTNGKAYRKWTVEIADHLGTRRKMQAFPDKGASTALGTSWRSWFPAAPPAARLIRS